MTGHRSFGVISPTANNRACSRLKGEGGEPGTHTSTSTLNGKSVRMSPIKIEGNSYRL
jgi:hypothetical protein